MIVMISKFEWSNYTMSKREYDPVHERDGKWYFWDETWAYESEPFDTEEQANGALQVYCDKLYEEEFKRNCN